MSQHSPTTRQAPDAGEHAGGGDSRADLAAAGLAMLDQLPAMVWVSDRNARCAFVNAEWLRFTGRSLESALGDGWADSVHEEDRAGVVSAFREAFARRVGFDGEYRIRRHDGAYRWVHDVGRPRHDERGGFAGFVGNCMEVHDRRESEEAIKEMRFAIENAMTGISLLDREGRFVEVRRGYAAMLGYEPEEMIGMSWRRVVPEADQAAAVAAMQTMLADGQTEIETRALRKDGSTFVKQLLLVRRVDGHGRHIGHYCFMRDVTERRSLEQQLLHAERVKAVGQLTSGVAHNFNNMLQGVVGNLELALEDASPRVACRLHEAMKAAEQAIDVVRQLLIYARGGESVSTQEVDLRAITHRAVKICVGTFDRRIAIQTALRPTPPVAGEIGQLEQVLVNLLLNARDAVLGVGGRQPTIRIETDHETDTAGTDWVRVWIRDNGPGLADEVRGRIFEPFFTTKDVGQGTGLGLSTAQAIVKHYGGCISCDSEAGRGATFLVRLPALSAARGRGEGRRAAAARSGRRVLLVEDEALVRQTVEQILASHGVEAISAADGEQALAMFEAEASALDAVLLDLSLPRMPGEELLQRLREQAPDLALIVLSGRPVDPASLPAASAVLQKPLTSEELLARVGALLDANGAAAGAEAGLGARGAV